MDIAYLRVTPSWDWPANAARLLLDTIQAPDADPADRLLATRLAGDLVVMNDELAHSLLDILRSDEIPDEVRAQAAISLGPVLEHCDMDDFDDPEELVITEPTFNLIQDTLRILYRDPEVPNEVRRRVLEGAIRAPSDWHKDAVRAAYYSDDPAWKLTAVFAMRFVSSFEDQIVEALESDDDEVRCEAIRAAGVWEVEAGWPHVRQILTSASPPRPLLLAAIEAAGSVGGEEGLELLQEFSTSNDEEIADAADEALLDSASRGWGSLEWDEEDEIDGIWSDPGE